MLHAESETFATQTLLDGFAGKSVTNGMQARTPERTSICQPHKRSDFRSKRT
jgi:hypothetical protein